jgi:hypothetical protein
MNKNTRAANKLLILAIAGMIGSVPAFADSSSPTEAYMKYRAALLAANKVEDIEPMLSKNGVNQINQTPDKDKPMMFNLIQVMTPHDVKVLSESVTGDAATLTLSGVTEPPGSKAKETTSGSVKLVKEDGAWKVDKEDWQSKIEAGGDGAAPGK